MPVGDVFENPVTGERGIVLVDPAENADRRLIAELTVQPGGRVVGEHFHSYIHEAFEVLEGRIDFQVDGQRQAAISGVRVEVPPGTRHDWWNAGDVPAIARVEVAPGDRFVLMIQTLFGLAAEGKTNAKGMPGPLQLAVFGREFLPEVEFTSPPRAVQRAMFGTLAPLGWALGRRPWYAEHAAPHGYVDVDLEAMRARPAGRDAVSP